MKKFLQYCQFSIELFYSKIVYLIFFCHIFLRNENPDVLKIIRQLEYKREKISRRNIILNVNLEIERTCVRNVFELLVCSKLNWTRDCHADFESIFV